MGLPFNYADFRGGFNSYNAYDDLADNEARDVVNVQGTSAGAIVKRNGFTTLASLTNTLTSLYVPSGATAPSWVLGADNVAGSLIRYDADAGGATTLKSGLTTGTLWEWVRGPVVSGQGPSFGIDGTNTPQWWNDATTTVGNWTNASGAVAVPNGKYCVFHQNQVFVAGTASNPSRLYWSAIGDPTNWDPASLTGAGSMDFDPNDGDSITGIGTVGPYLLVFKPSKTWILVDPATATARRLSDNVGCVAHRSIARGQEGTYFLGLDRVWVTNGSKLTPISDKISPTLNISSVLTRNQAVACYTNQHYFLSLNLVSPTNDTILDYDAKLNSWWKHGQGVNDWALRNAPQNFQAETIYAANAVVGPAGPVLSKAFQPGVYRDNGFNFAWSWSGPWQSPTFYRRRRFPTPFFRKRLKQTRYDGLGQVDFSVCKDFNPTPTLVASDIFANSSITKEARSYGQGVANVFSVVFSGTYPTAAQINQYTLMVADRKDSMGGGY